MVGLLFSVHDGEAFTVKYFFTGIFLVASKSPVLSNPPNKKA